jgi:hypothetical protein
MFTSTFVLVSSLLVDTASAHKEKGNNWDPAAAEALEAKVREMFAAFDKGNVGPFVEGLDTPAITWDIGFDGDPIMANTREESQKVLEGYATWMKDEDAKVTTTIQRADCHSTATAGFCVLEFDQDFTVGGQPQPKQMFRATLVARAVDGQWKWSHWHASSRAATAVAQ